MNTASAQRSTGHLIPWKPGQSGNPRGREKGSRNKLAEQFITDLFEVWQDAGPGILRVAAVKNPVAFAQMVSSLMPRNVRLEHDASQAFVDVLRQMNERRIA